jgi:hypothetical protein
MISYKTMTPLGGSFVPTVKCRVRPEAGPIGLLRFSRC